MYRVYYIMWWLALLVVVVYFIYVKNRSCFKGRRLSDASREQMTGALIKNQSVIKTNYTNTKRALGWVDPVMYEDVRNLILDGNFNAINIKQIL
jgi:hypothetical protein